jgi:cell wall-associated NlpC family hydrolase
MPGGQAVVITTEGDRLTVRSGAGRQFAVVGSLAEGTVVAVLDGPQVSADGIAWLKIQGSGITGWASAEWLGDVGAAPAAGSLAPGDSAQVVNTDGYVLRIRARPGLDAPIVSFVPAGAVVMITQAAQADSTGALWYGIDYTGIKGWVLGEHLARSGVTPAAVPTAQPSASPSAAPRTTPSPTPSPVAQPVSVPPAGDRGQTIITVAQKYLGAPYVYGGTTPAGWDCSGFVGYIYKEAAGISLPRSAAQQYRVGTPIAVGQEQPGDIVFFADTFGPGITHNGIAIGGGRFIHARSEGYGTVINSLTDAYWSQHYVGARRP